MAEQNNAEWYFLAAILGDAEAQYTQGVSEKGSEEAGEWFRKAAEQGHAGAQYELGRSSGYSQAKAWFAKAAEQGHAGAQYELGRMYQQGCEAQRVDHRTLKSYWKQEVPKDYSQALNWYLKAAKQGHVGAHYCLGLLYAEGNGVPQDDH